MSRSTDADEVRRADKAAAIGRLMLGELHDIGVFLSVAERNYAELPRRALKSGRADVKARLSGELDKFCRANFDGMTIGKLSKLYDDAAPSLGSSSVFVLPLPEFQERYARVRPAALQGAPAYSTAVLTLRGLRYRFPEQQLAGDLISALDLLKISSVDPGPTRSRQDYVARNRRFAARSCLAIAFNLLEALLNGLLWEFLQTGQVPSGLTTKQRELLAEPTRPTLRFKLDNLPIILAGAPLVASLPLNRVLDSAKRHRDALAHPSPFLAPATLGGYDKLEHFYAVDGRVARDAVSDVVAVIDALLIHTNRARPGWLVEVDEAFHSPHVSELERQHGGPGLPEGAV